MDPHEVLGVPKDATPAEVKAAYRRLSMVHHPDRGGDAEDFKRVAEAYERCAHPPPPPRREAAAAAAGDDVQSVGLSERDVLFGGPKSFFRTRRVPCRACEGTGIANPQRNVIRCRECDGVPGAEGCRGCGGRGWFVLRAVPCAACDRSGVCAIRRKERIDLRAGAVNGSLHDATTRLVHRFDTDRLRVEGGEGVVRVDVSVKEVLLGFVRRVELAGVEHTLRVREVWDPSRDRTLPNEWAIPIKARFRVVFDENERGYLEKVRRALLRARVEGDLDVRDQKHDEEG